MVGEIMFCDSELGIFYWCKGGSTINCPNPPIGLGRISCRKYNCKSLLSKKLVQKDCSKRLDMVMRGGFCIQTCERRVK